MRVNFANVFAGMLVLFLSITIAAQTERGVSSQQSSTLRVPVDLVLLDVNVRDGKGQPVTDMEQQDFTIYEDKIEQSIGFFSEEESPVTWGLVLDRSGSMQGMIRGVYEAAVHVLDEGTNDDEMFIVTFSDRVELVSEFTSDRRTLRESLFGLNAQGQTALYDAVAFALDSIKEGQHRKKVLVVITDGEDNHSSVSLRRLIDRIKESDVLIYTVGMFNSMGARLHNSMKSQLEQLAEITGGYGHFPTDVEKCRQAMAAIAHDVSQHYTIGYYPSNREHDGSWRKLKVAVRTSDQQKAKYIVRTRSGYYAPGAAQ